MFRAMSVTIFHFRPLTLENPFPDKWMPVLTFWRSFIRVPTNQHGCHAVRVRESAPSNRCHPNLDRAAVIEESRHSPATPICIAPRQRAFALNAYRTTLSAGVSDYRYSEQTVLIQAFCDCLLPDHANPHATSYERGIWHRSLSLSSGLNCLQPISLVDFKTETSDDRGLPLLYGVDQLGAGAVT